MRACLPRVADAAIGVVRQQEAGGARDGNAARLDGACKARGGVDQATVAAAVQVAGLLGLDGPRVADRVQLVVNDGAVLLVR